MKLIYLSMVMSMVLIACQSHKGEAQFDGADEGKQAGVGLEESNTNLSNTSEFEIKEGQAVIEQSQIIEAPILKKEQQNFNSYSESPVNEVLKANIESLQEPNAYLIQNSLVMYNYKANFIYKVYTSPQRVTVIKLDSEEKIIGDLVSGDTANWIMAVSEDKNRNIVYIKPVRINVSTNLIINTSARTYNLIIKSMPETYMVSVEWRYPLQEIRKMEKEKNILEIPVSLESLYFGYKVIPLRKDPVWKPIKIFDDGTRTFIQFKNKLNISESPVLFAVDGKRKTVLVNYRVIEDYYVVDRVLYNAELRVGNKRRDTIKIVRLKKK